MNPRVLGAVALVAVVAAGGAVWLVVRREWGRRTSSARILRRLVTVSTTVLLVTLVFVRPWYADVAVGAVAVGALGAVYALLRALERRPSPPRWDSIAAALVSVVVGSALVTAGAASAVIDTVALLGGEAVPVAHEGQVLVRPVLYQLFWGPAWAARPAPPALAQAGAFQRALPRSRWAARVVDAGFGIRSLSSGGCFVDPSLPSGHTTVASTGSGAFSDEIHDALLLGKHHLLSCLGTPAAAVPRTLAPGAVVALWLAPSVRDELGGVSSHGTTPWLGRQQGLAVVALTGAFAQWGTRRCAPGSACSAAIPSYATPTYALSHELVETATNPDGQGWFADAPLRWSARYDLSHGPGSLLSAAPVFQGEVADLCEPGQPDARPPLAGTLGASRLAVAPFYSPGVGCVS